MAKCKVHPIGNRVLVLPDIQDKTAGGIHLTDAAKENCRRGVIVRVGCGDLNEAGGPRGFEGMYFPPPPGVKVGAKVLYGRYAVSDSKGLDDLAGHVLVNVADIIGVIED